MSKNAVEQAVTDAYESLIGTQPQFCNCVRCRDDAITLALNHARPRYMTGTRLGSAVTRVELEQDASRVEIMVLVLDAMRQVAKAPRHDRT